MSAASGVLRRLLLEPRSAWRTIDPLERRLRGVLYLHHAAAALLLSLADGSPIWFALVLLAGLLAAVLIDSGSLAPLRTEVLWLGCVVLVCPLWIGGCHAAWTAGPAQAGGAFVLPLLARSIALGGAVHFFGRKELGHYRSLALAGLACVLLSLPAGGGPSIALGLLLYVFTALFFLQVHSRWRVVYTLHGRGWSGGAAGRIRWGVGPRALGGQLLLAELLLLGALLGAGLLFVALPRRGSPAGELEREERVARSLETLTGFSEDLSLGGIGELKESFEPALFVRPEGGADLDELRQALRGRPPYWRGVAYASYDPARRMWRAPELDRAPRLSDGGAGDADGRRDGAIRFTRPGPPDRAPLRYEVELMLTQSRVLFGIAHVRELDVALARPPGLDLDGSIQRDAEDALWCAELSGGVGLKEGTRYRLGSLPVMPGRSERHRIHAAAAPDPRYLEVPGTIARDRGLRSITALLGASLARESGAEGRPSLAAIESVVIAFLRNNFRYSLALVARPGDELDPLLRFLNAPGGEGAGPCLFFASAMAMINRTLGIPTRVVSGFCGGELRDRLWVITQAHAHAWVEVYCGEQVGWVSMDPTPAEHLPSSARMALIDGLASEAEPDLEDRNRGDSERSAEEVARDLWEGFDAFDRAQQEALFAWVGTLFQRLAASVQGPLGASLLALLGGGALLGLLARWRWRRRACERRRFGGRQLSGEQRAAVRLYDELLRLLAAQGVIRPPAMTPAELARRVHREVNAECGVVVDGLTALFERIRYGEQVPHAGELEGARNEVLRLREVLAAAHSRGGPVGG